MKAIRPGGVLRLLLPAVCPSVAIDLRSRDKAIPGYVEHLPRKKVRFYPRAQQLRLRASAVVLERKTLHYRSRRLRPLLGEYILVLDTPV
jgi:hypothetical protein